MATDPRESERRRDVAPVVPLPRAGLSGAAIAILCALLGLALFLILDNRRRALERAGEPVATAGPPLAAPPPLAMPPAPAPPPPTPVALAPPPPASQPVPPAARTPPVVAPQPIVQPLVPPPSPAPARTGGEARSTPVLVLDRGAGGIGPAPAAAAAGPEAASAAGDDQAVRATVIRNRAALVPQGTLIPAVLETPIDSSRAGLARALVSRDVRGFDGTRVLIPRGSRLIGEAKGDVQAGARRVLVTWTRLIRPDGVAIRIGSPGADNLGGAGLAGRVNSYFLERFANAVLQSALAIGVNRAARIGDGGVIVGIPGQVGGAVGQTPVFDVPAGPTVKVPQGAEIAIFVARDLDFGGAAPRP
jgi:type IV secretion system protein VirB10